MDGCNGLGMGLGGLWRLSDAESRSISAENPTGEKGRGAAAEPGGPSRELGKGWKCRPSVRIEPGETFTMGDVDGPGAVQSIWLTGTFLRHRRRNFILRFYWDGQESPSIECPVGDFFASGWNVDARVNSLPVAVNPRNGMNCFWEMPFRTHCRITVENRDPEAAVLYYQVNYTLTDVPDDAAYFHAQFRRTPVVPCAEPYTIADGIRGRGHYVGTVLHVGLNGADRWWGEGEIKFYIDGDDDLPTICGTGTEDYFGGSYDWDMDGKYVTYSTPFVGMHQVIQPDGLYVSQQRFAMYRWHVMDPIRFRQDLRVTIQDLGWRSEGRFLARQDDFASVAYWYQTLPAAPLPPLGSKDELEII